MSIPLLSPDHERVDARPFFYQSPNVSTSSSWNQSSPPSKRLHLHHPSIYFNSKKSEFHPDSAAALQFPGFWHASKTYSSARREILLKRPLRH
mmetsp:Transcript_19761/g.39370  ORF Transcript_19761/g.39370 Transcript_19761/m.39370 type:complete len:93 (-) Transcript_19761:731-1009(-)